MSPSDLLAVFREELPDPNLELYNRAAEIVSFHNFQNLPELVKDMIWDFARDRTVLATIDRDGVLHSRTPPPVTFRVCKESRESTMKHYQIPENLGGNDDENNPRVKPLNSPLHLHFFDPKVDTLILHGRTPSDFSCYYEYHASDVSEDLGQIKSLQVKRYDWAMLMFKGWKSWSEGRNAHFTYFRCFNGLENLTIVGGGHGLRTKDEQEDCKTALTRVFADFDNMFGNYDVPKVYIKME
jgi:hypothetical protein